MKKKIAGIVIVLVFIVLAILGYDYYKLNSYEAPAPITDEATGQVISTPQNAINSIPPDGIIIKDKPF